MNSTISTFLKIAVTVVSISAFLFFVGYNMISGESTEYKTEIESISDNVPSATQP